MDKQYYIVERLEGNEWVIKCQTDFEDVNQFKEVANRIGYRITYGGVDITSRYSNNYTPLKNTVSTGGNADMVSPMKPAQFKALSTSEQQELVNRAKDLKEKKFKRNEIFKMLNVSEATYDLINAYNKDLESPQQNASSGVTSTSQTSSTQKVKVTTSTTSQVHTLKRGLFAKR